MLYEVITETRRIYDLLISNTGSSDEEIEVYLRHALADLLKRKIDEMQALRNNFV